MARLSSGPSRGQSDGPLLPHVLSGVDTTVVTACAQPLAHDILGTHLYRRGARRVADLAPRRSRIAIDVREGVDQTLVEREVEKPSGPRWLR